MGIGNASYTLPARKAAAKMASIGIFATASRSGMWLMLAWPLKD